MFRRPSIRASVTTLAAAGILVGGANIASYAASGHPLILGHANSAGGTTALKNTGRGPALSLNSIRTSPPLVVTSSKVVKHLNADMVGGQKASQLNPAVWRFTVGRDASPISLAQHFFTAKLPAGTYQVQMSGILTDSTTTDSYVCAIGDKAKLVANNIAGIYTYALGQFTSSAAIISDVYTTKIVKGRAVLYGCNLEGDTGPVTVAKAMQFTFRQIPVTDKHGTPFTIGPRNATGGGHLLGR